MMLMVNLSDRRFQTLSPTRAREAARLIENEARGNPSRPGASSDARQAGRIYNCNPVPHRVCTSTRARGRGPYMAGGAGWIRTLGTVGFGPKTADSYRFPFSVREPYSD